ncbi:hypothetical protein ASC66_12340 [Leifsonia sp. Root4]|uniref:iron chaperone n=1 Tax=Leifsonia sp. Root4 TaxID=1736525 RepID=UPI0007000D16|nr:DUF1801 domain-containing protein [Leifsonia sp. Root4]KQW05745.1 hypothetical protein ASC66_12340 [Leifsonia sp. Root4]
MSETPKTRSTTKSGFSAEERAAMRERAKELKASANREEAAKAVVDMIAEMPPADRALAARVHTIIVENAPTLAPKLWYGMPSYARDGKIVCFFQSAEKFKTRYATLGFNEDALLDDGTMWPTAYALTQLDEKNEAFIADLVKRAAG